MADIESIKNQIKDEIKVDQEGKGAASIAGTSRLVDIAHQTLSDGFRNSTSKLAQNLIHHGFEPRSFSESGVPDIAVALTVAYYANKAGKRCTEQARMVNEVLLAVGVRTWMQQVVGWEPQSTTSGKVYTIDMVVRREAMVWERMFLPSWIVEAENLTGWKWTWKAMSGFIMSTVYAYLPCDVVITLRQLNPKDQHGNRNHKHHQFLQPEIRDIVTTHLNIVEDLMKAAKGNMSLFELIMANRFGRYKLIDNEDGQMMLFDIETKYLPRASE